MDPQSNAAGSSANPQSQDRAGTQPGRAAVSALQPSGQGGIKSRLRRSTSFLPEIKEPPPPKRKGGSGGLRSSKSLADLLFPDKAKDKGKAKEPAKEAEAQGGEEGKAPSPTSPSPSSEGTYNFEAQLVPQPRKKGKLRSSLDSMKGLADKSSQAVKSKCKGKKKASEEEDGADEASSEHDDQSRSSDEQSESVSGSSDAEFSDSKQQRAKSAAKSGLKKVSNSILRKNAKAPAPRVFLYVPLSGEGDQIAQNLTADGDLIQPVEVDDHVFKPQKWANVPRPEGLPKGMPWPPNEAGDFLWPIRNDDSICLICHGHKTDEICAKDCRPLQWRKQVDWRGKCRFVEDPDTGVGVVTLRSWASGEKLGEYLGELVPNEEDPSGEYSLGLHVTDRSSKQIGSIDATAVGNWTRFLPHSCDANCEMFLARVGATRLHVIGARTDIAAGEELSIDYGTEYFRRAGMFCKCRSPICRYAYNPEALFPDTSGPGSKGKAKVDDLRWQITEIVGRGVFIPTGEKNRQACLCVRWKGCKHLTWERVTTVASYFEADPRVREMVEFYKAYPLGKDELEMEVEAYEGNEEPKKKKAGKPRKEKRKSKRGD